MCDSHELTIPKKKSEGYHIHEGSNELEVSQSLTNKGGPIVKKNCRVSGIEPLQRTRWKKGCHGGVGERSLFSLAKTSRPISISLFLSSSMTVSVKIQRVLRCLTQKRLKQHVGSINTTNYEEIRLYGEN